MSNFWCWTTDADHEEDGKHIVARDSLAAAAKAAERRRLTCSAHWEHWSVRAEGAAEVESFTVEERLSPSYYASASGAAAVAAPIFCSCGQLEEMHSNADGSCRWWDCACEKFDPVVGFPMKRQ